MGRIGDILRERFEARQKVVTATVTGVPRDAQGFTTGLIRCTIGSATNVPVFTTPEAIHYTGDEIRVRQYGTAAAASYAVDSILGHRSPSGFQQFGESTTVGGVTYIPNDLVLGDMSGHEDKPNWYYDSQQGGWYIRNGITVHGLIGYLRDTYGYGSSNAVGAVFGRYGPGLVTVRVDDQSGYRIMRGDWVVGHWALDGSITLGADTGYQILLDPVTGRIDFLYQGDLVSSWDAGLRTIWGIERFGAPHGPALELGETVNERYTLRVLGREGVPFFGVVSGTPDDPDDVQMMVGPPDAVGYLRWQDNELEVVGDITATGGEFSGTVNITGLGKLTWDSAKGVLDSAGLAHDEDANNYWYVKPDSDQYMKLVTQTATYSIYTENNNATAARGIYSYDKSGGGACYGIYGESDGYTGVRGDSHAAWGVIGYNDVSGFAGVYGVSTLGTGVFGQAGTAPDPLTISNAYGIYGWSGSGATGDGSFGYGEDTHGVHGLTSASNKYGVYGRAVRSGGIGVVAEAQTNATVAFKAIGGDIDVNSQEVIGEQNIIWLSPLDAVPYTQLAHRVWATAINGNSLLLVDATTPQYIAFPFSVPYKKDNAAVQVTSVIVYGYTADNSAYINSVVVYALDLSGGSSAAINHTDDIGNGSSGDFNHDIVDSNYTMTDYPHTLVLNCAGIDNAADIEIYGIRIAYQTITT